jgi:hypothetical protein
MEKNSAIGGVSCGVAAPVILGAVLEMWSPVFPQNCAKTKGFGRAPAA